MSKSKKIFSPAVRKRKAYATATRVFLSYLWLHLKSKIFGRGYYDQRINALHLKNADRIKNRIQELQGLFIKIGQLISNLSNILPKEFRGPLEDLQDHVAAKPYAEIEKTIIDQLGNKPENIFSSFSKEPLAAASIGQVHRAEINGQAVVVKIQHQHIDKIAKADLQILENLVKLHAYFMNMRGLDHTYEQVRQMIEEELNYSKEAAAMKTIGARLAEVPELNVKVPTVFEKYSSSKVLTAEFYEGINISRVEELKKWGLDLEDLAKRLIELYCKMILVDGHYHADPHPGNILVNKKGELVLIDFGAVAHLTEKTKKAIPELIEAVIRNNTEDIVQALRSMGFLGSDRDSKRYVKKLVNIFKEFIQEEVEFDGMNFQNIKLNSGLSSLSGIIQKVDLREVSNTIRIPKDYILLNRTLVLLLGNAFQLAPELNTLEVVQPYIKKQIRDKDFGFAQMIVKTFKNQVATAISLPNELSQFLKDANDRDLESEIRGVKNGLQKIYFLGQQVLLSIFLFGAIFFFRNQSTTGELVARPVWYWLLIGGIGLLLLRSIYRDFKTKQP